MARLPRLVLPGQPHLLVQRTLDRQPLFVDEEDRASLTDALRHALETEPAQLHALALRERELQFLVTPTEADALARLMQAIGRRYVVAYNRRHGRRGPLWDVRFRACPVERGEHTLIAMAWVEQALQASDVTSAAHHSGGPRIPWITDPPEFWSLGNTPFEREGAWRERLAQGVSDAAATQLRATVLGGWAFGSPTFIHHAGAGGRPATPRRPGRPRRTAPPY